MSGSSDGGGGASDDDFDGGGGGDASSESAAESLDEGASDAEAAAAPASDDDAAAPAKKRQRTAGKGKARAEASPSENAGGSNGQEVGRVPPTCAPAPRPGELRSRLIGGSGSPDDAQGVTLPVSADDACWLSEHARVYSSLQLQDGSSIAVSSVTCSCRSACLRRPSCRRLRPGQRSLRWQIRCPQVCIHGARQDPRRAAAAAERRRLRRLHAPRAAGLVQNAQGLGRAAPVVGLQGRQLGLGAPLQDGQVRAVSRCVRAWRTGNSPW